MSVVVQTALADLGICERPCRQGKPAVEARKVKVSRPWKAKSGSGGYGEGGRESPPDQLED